MDEDLNEIYAKINGELKRIKIFVDADVGNVFIQCMLYDDYENIDDIAGHEVCTDELVFINPWLSNNEELQERFKYEFD